MGDVPLTEALLICGADPNFPTREPWTPLHEAIERGNLLIIRILIDYGADIHKKTITGRDALCIALEHNRMEASRLLLERGAIIENGSEYGRKALAKALQRSDDKMVNLLCAAGAREPGYRSANVANQSRVCEICPAMETLLPRLEALLDADSSLGKVSRGKRHMCGRCRMKQSVTADTLESSIPDMETTILEGPALPNRMPSLSYPIANNLFVECKEDVTRHYSPFPSSYKRTQSALQTGGFWLHECLTQHPTCFPASLELPPLPTRVIDVGSSGQNMNPRLYISNGQQGFYLTLSYVWGRKSFRRTTKHNLESHLKCIPFNTLPRTMRDAIALTRMFGLRYLWIDALCIIQDSEEDWFSESQTMATIFRRSLFTIMVDGNDPSMGLFKRNWLGKPISCAPDPPDSSDSLDSHELNSAPNPQPWLGLRPHGHLDTRAWIMQEQLLSRRILSFAERRLYWDCLTISASESSLNGYSVDTTESGILRVFLGTTANNIRDQRALSAWRNIVEQYSTRQITYGKDKLVATLGFAQVVAEILNDEFIGGLWKKRLWKDLLWWVNAPGLPTQHQRLSGTPSWSWASVMDSISYTLPYGVSDSSLRSCIDIIDVTTNWNIEEGKLTGVVKLRGSLIQMPQESSGSNLRYTIVGTDWMPESYGEWPPLPTWRPDVQVERHCIPFLPKLHYLPIALTEYYVIGLGITLSGRLQEVQEYKRAGLFYWHRAHNNHIYNCLLEGERRINIGLV